MSIYLKPPVLTLLLCIINFNLWADSQLGLQFSLGSSYHYGELSNDNGNFTKDFQIQTLFYKSEKYKIESHLALNIFSLKATHHYEKFPFSKNAEIGVLSFLFIPTICNLHFEKSQLCLGIGQGTVNVNQSGTRRDYGSWNYQFAYKYHFNESWSFISTLKYIGRVEQENTEVESYFSILSLLAGLNWRP